MLPNLTEAPSWCRSAGNVNGGTVRIPQELPVSHWIHKRRKGNIMDTALGLTTQNDTQNKTIGVTTTADGVACV